MTPLTIDPTKTPVQQVFAIIRTVLQRMRKMAGAWSLLGAAMGLNCEALFEGNRIALLANILAWMIVMSVTGAMVSLFGGRPLDSWVGAGLGGLIATVAGLQLMPGESSSLMQINFAALVGALVAATCWPWVRIVAMLYTRLRRGLLSAH